MLIGTMYIILTAIQKYIHDVIDVDLRFWGVVRTTSHVAVFLACVDTNGGLLVCMHACTHARMMGLTCTGVRCTVRAGKEI